MSCCDMAGRHCGKPDDQATGHRKADGDDGKADKHGDVEALMMDESDDDEDGGCVSAIWSAGVCVWVGGGVGLGRRPHGVAVRCVCSKIGVPSRIRASRCSASVT